MGYGNFGAHRPKVSRKKKRQWSAKEKLMVITYYEQGHSKRSTADKFEIEPKQLRDWLKNKDKLMLVAPHVQKLVRGVRPKYQQLEDELMEWFKESQRQSEAITCYTIQAKARSLAKKPLYQRVYPDIKDAKFSQKWVDRFMSRHNLINKRKSTLAQQLPDDYIKQQNQFLSYVLFCRKEHQYPLSLIANMDEIPMTFNLPSDTTIEQNDSNSDSNWNETVNFIVVLACMANGEKLPPVIIFKLLSVPQVDYPDDIIVRANSNGWMNEEEMTWWIENIWSERAINDKNPKSLLVLDSFAAHKTEAIKSHFHKINTDLAVIPGRLTSRLQPFDVLLNKPFKAKMQNLYNNWMDETIKKHTSSEKVKKPFYSLVANWVKESWDAINTNMIKCSFKCCGISNAVDGTEDGLIFDFGKIEKLNNKEKDIEEDESHGKNSSDESNDESEYSLNNSKNNNDDDNDDDDDDESEDDFNKMNEEEMC